jgi:hypothetical protein
MSKTYHLYISYSWLCHPDACEKKIKFLEKEGLHYKFLETFKTDHSSAEPIEVRIEKAIINADCLLMLAGVGETCDAWLEHEIRYAKKHGKPIIAIEPWLSKKTNEVLKENAQHIVQWHGKLIADAIRQSDQLN